MHIRPCPSLLKRASSPAPRKAMASSAIRRIWAMRSFGFRVSSFKFKYQRSCLKGRAFRRAESSSIFAIPSEVAAATESRDLLFSAVPTGLGLFIIAHQGLRPISVNLIKVVPRPLPRWFGQPTGDHFPIPQYGSQLRYQQSGRDLAIHELNFSPPTAAPWAS